MSASNPRKRPSASVFSASRSEMKRPPRSRNSRGDSKRSSSTVGPLEALVEEGRARDPLEAAGDGVDQADGVERADQVPQAAAGSDPDRLCGNVAHFRRDFNSAVEVADFVDEAEVQAAAGRVNLA